MQRSSLFASYYKDTPYWWDDAPRPQIDTDTTPASVEVAIVGSGYTGLNAAIETARGGRSTLVLDAEDAGWGCSSRNGGQISTSFKPSFDSLEKKYGAEKAYAILREGHNALQWIGEFVERENIDCDFNACGRFYAAHNARQYELLEKRAEEQLPGLEVDCHLVSRADQASEIESDLYHGGIVFNSHASLQPAKYHLGLLRTAQDAGTKIATHCGVDNIERDGAEFVLHTARGKVRARDVIVATSGYTGSLTPWHQRRIIPIGSYMIATEEIDDALMDRMLPRHRVYTDTRKLVVYYRASPDRKRVVFGGRVSLAETDPRISAPRLHDQMTNILPALRGTKISHSWMGFVGYTFDEMPHIGQHEGLWYAMGYCGSGVSLASYFGMRLGQKVLGLSEGETGIDQTRFETRPYYFGKPWFLAPSIHYYRIKDKLNL
ncbi:MAG: FAD-binding oxidoreductase [Pseudomonadota bacterium]